MACAGLDQKNTFSRCRQVWFVMSCGAEIGNAAKYNRLLCEEKDFDYMGTAQIVMPENYIAMFSTPAPEEAEKQLAAAYPVIEQAAQSIKKGECFPELPRTIKDKLNSGIVNDLFYPMFVHAKKFTATEACVSCGQCVQECPLKNIKLEAGHPVTARIAWPASAAVRWRPSNMASTRKVCRATPVRNPDKE